VRPLAAPRRERRRRALAALLLVGAIAVGGVATAAPVTAQTPDATAVADLVIPAVVDVEATFAFSRGQATGTGMILTESGQVLTNNHVVKGSTEVTVFVRVNGRVRSYDAVVLGSAPNSDVALLELEGASGLPTVALGDSSKLRAGDRVIAIGNTLGGGSSLEVTEGSVAALNKSITVSDGRGGTERLKGLIETSVALEPGNSGGPLVDEAGAVVGVNTAAEVERFAGEGSTTGFAITIEDAIAIVDQINEGDERDGVVIGPTAYLGVSARDAGSDPSERLGAGRDSGAVIGDVVPDSPAASVGIVEGDIVIAFGREDVDNAEELVDAVQARDPGETVRVTWIAADGTRRRAKVTLAEGPAA
jgi:S1-C subfamily serine protease